MAVIYVICIRASILIAIHLSFRELSDCNALRLLYHGASYSYWVRFKKNAEK